MGTLPQDWTHIRRLNLAPGFSVCELGNQVIGYSSPPRSTKADYVKMGCARYCSIDGNGKGTHTWDLNLPLNNFMRKELGLFDLLTDFGTGEHIFDQAQVWRTIHELTKVGGFIVFSRPHQGYEKHCYYSINPCLLREVAASNHYELLEMHVAVTNKGKLINGALQKRIDGEFIVPQQGRYHPILTPIMGSKSA